jgi:hypothetical protein
LSGSSFGASNHCDDTRPGEAPNRGQPEEALEQACAREECHKIRERRHRSAIAQDIIHSLPLPSSPVDRKILP